MNGISHLEHGSVPARDSDDDLPALAEVANAAYVGAQGHIGAALDEVLQGGRALLAAKKKIQHGEWESWLHDHFNGSARTARAWMLGAKRVARAGNGKTATVPISSLRALIAPDNGDTERSGLKSSGTRRAPAAVFDVLEAEALKLDDRDRARLAWALAKSLPRSLLKVMVGAIESKLLDSETETGGGTS